jgi:hypothetical protein
LSRDGLVVASLTTARREALVTANLGLVHAVVNQQWPIYYKLGITKEELVQEGSLFWVYARRRVV